ncbi:MAG: hypothetical protein ABW360_09920 [Phenylobacterium sp.]
MRGLSETARGRWSVAFRTLAGTLGAYGLTSLAVVVASLLAARLGLAKAEAVTAATLASFALFAAVAMAIFHVPSAARAWGWLAVASVTLGAVWLGLAGSAP